MRLPQAFFAARWLVRDTFQQALANYLFWLLLVASSVCILLCLSARVEGVRSLHHPEAIELLAPGEKPLSAPPRAGHLSLLFGALRVPFFRDAEAEVHFLATLLALGVAGTAGTLLILVWTAGFLPDFLQPSVASVLLVKPVPRWSLLAGKYLGVLVFVAVQAGVFIGGTWLALGLRTQIWLYGYLLCIPLLLLNFAMLYSVSTMLAVWTRNTILCIFGSILFWVACFALNYGRHALATLSAGSLESASGMDRYRSVVDMGYWILPKPADLLLILNHGLQLGEHISEPEVFTLVQKTGAFDPELSLLSSGAFTVAAVLFASWRFAHTDY
jgi:ABC-type transport system involved in multi-copper enzyme maturation permease subunit